MIGLDTNVLVRYVVEDDAEQLDRAARLIEDSGRQPFFVSWIVVCELAWVLDSCYGRSRGEVAEIVGDLLRVRQFALEEPALLRLALGRFERNRGDLADYLIAERAQAEGCEEVATFDKALLSEPGFFEPRA